VRSTNSADGSADNVGPVAVDKSQTLVGDSMTAASSLSEGLTDEEVERGGASFAGRPVDDKLESASSVSDGEERCAVAAGTETDYRPYHQQQRTVDRAVEERRPTGDRRPEEHESNMDIGVEDHQPRGVEDNVQERRSSPIAADGSYVIDDRQNVVNIAGDASVNHGDISALPQPSTAYSEHTADKDDDVMEIFDNHVTRSSPDSRSVTSA